MRYQPGENFEEWAKRVEQAELKNARHLLDKGVPVEQVLEILSIRLSQKLLHPIIIAVKDVKTNYNSEEEKKRYEETYRTRGPVADHVVRDEE